jgi:hypothetical protein
MKPPSRTPADPGKAVISLVALAMERFNASDSTMMAAVCRPPLPALVEGDRRSVPCQEISAVDDADAGQHDAVWPLLMRRFRVEKGALAGQGFDGQVRIAKWRD